MIRYGMGILAAAGAIAAIGLSACSDDPAAPPLPPLASGGATGSGGTPASGATTGSGATPGSGGGSSAGCVGECCPTSATCYSGSGPSSPGGECMARYQNPNPLVKPVTGHITMRQSWIRVMEPVGNTIALVYGALNAYTQLPEAVCNAPNGTSGYMQISDMDLTNTDPTKHTSTVGYATYVEDVADTIANGACFGTVAAPGWKQKAAFPTPTSPVEDFSLPESAMSDSSKFPKGLRKPMSQQTAPWTMGPSVAVRLTTDFNVATERTALLESLDDGGSRAQYDGVFFFDEAKGEIHGYSPLSWQIFYDARTGTETKPSAGFLLPIREVELHFKTNNPAAPNCIGRYRSDFLTQATDCTNPEPATPPWGGIFNTTPGEGDAEILGYFLITELEQVYSKVLGSTLCVSYPTAAASVAAGFGTDADKRCRAPGPGKWDPAKPDNAGLPMGNWCAATNSAATATCHDAWRSRSFHAFQGFKVKPQTCPVEWAPTVP